MQVVYDNVMEISNLKCYI